MFHNPQLKYIFPRQNTVFSTLYKIHLQVLEIKVKIMSSKMLQKLPLLHSSYKTPTLLLVKPLVKHAIIIEFIYGEVVKIL